MTHAQSHRGAAPVCAINELPELEAAAVMYLRLWCDSPDGQAEVWRDYHSHFGGEDAKARMSDFEQLMSVVLNHARRPLQRHQITCKCVGGDENAFANFVVAAAVGDREDAMLFAANLVRPDMSFTAASMAEPVGLALAQMVMRGSLGPQFPNPTSITRH